MSVAAVAKTRQTKATILSRELAIANQAYDEIVDWLTFEETLDLPLHEVEKEQEERMRELSRLLLQAHVDARGPGDVGQSVEVRGDGDVTHRQRRGSDLARKYYKSIFGQIELHRIYYEAPDTRRVHPLDEQLSLPERRFSYEYQRRAVKASVQGPYDEAVGRLVESIGQCPSKRSVENLVVDAARHVEEFYSSRPVRPPDEAGPFVALMADSKGVPMVKEDTAVKRPRRTKGQKANRKKMATVAAVYTQQRRIRTPKEVVESLFRSGPRLPRNKSQQKRPEDKRVWASLKASKKELLLEAREEAERRNPDGTKQRLCLMDGCLALRRQADKLLKDYVQILDLLHVLEKLWKMAYCFHEEGSDEAIEWARYRTLRILQGDVSLVVRGIRQSATKRGLSGNSRTTIDSACNYMLKNKHRMRYDEYLAQGFPIATGPVEGACKNLIKDRMERSGMRWKLDGAEAMLRLRATYLSGDFEEYWQYHVDAEAKRLYPPDRWSPTDQQE